MASEKRNTFLDAEESDDDDVRGYDSEADELRKGGVSRSAKRRKLEDDGSSDEDEDEDDADVGVEKAAEVDDRFNLDRYDAGAQNEIQATEPKKSSKKRKQAGDDGGGDDGSGDDEGEAAPKKKANLSKDAKLSGESLALFRGNLVTTRKAIRRSGVIYLSRIPPFMKPSKLRSLLEPYGEINRIFMSPENRKSRARRIKFGGNKKRSFVDGWVEFTRKKDAKAAVDLLNGQTIGGKKGSFYRDDVWGMTYLRGFKWHDLTAQIAEEDMERESRLKAELAQDKVAAESFLENVELSKTINGIQSKREAKGKRTRGEDEEATAAAPKGETGSSTGPARERRLIFEQNTLAKKNSDNQKTVQSVIFGRI